MCNLSTVYQATILFRANGGTAKTNFTGGHRNSGEELRGIAEIVAIVGAIKATKKGSTIGHFSHRNDETSKTR